MSTVSDASEPTEKDASGHDHPKTDVRLPKWLMDDRRILRKAFALVEQHPWLVAAYIGSLVLGRIMVEARGDIPTATMLLGSAGFSGIAAAVSMTAVPALVISLFIIAFVFLGYTVGERKREKTSILAALSLSLISLLLMGMIFEKDLVLLILGITVVAAGLCGIGIFIVGGTNAQLPLIAPTVAVALLIALAAPFASFINPTATIWLPLETITVENHKVTGYVIKEDGGQAIILNEGDRRTITVESEAIEERKRCQLHDPETPWISLTGQPPQYPGCESSSPGPDLP